KPETKEVLRRNASLHPRVAIYKPWSANLGEGWTRWLLDTYGFKPASLSPQDVKSGKPLAFDAIILPDADKATLATGARASEDGGGFREEMPPEYRGGIEKAGGDTLRGFVENGGTLIAFNQACDYVLSEFNLPVRNVLAGVKRDDFSVPGSLLRVNVNTDHPVTKDMPSQAA